MSCADDSENSSFSGRVTPPESTTLSSSRTSSSSNLGENSSTSDPANGSVSLPVSASSGSQDVPRSAEDERQPQLDTSDVSLLLEYRSVGSPDVDPQIIEALKSKDRLFVLKLGEQMEALIKERHSRSRIRLSPENQYQRLLVHRCAQYYKLAPDNETKLTHKEMTVMITVESCIPLQRISELVPAERQPQATFKIMRRAEPDRRRQRSSTSRAGSVAAEDGDMSDPGPSETGSMGSRSTTSKKHKTIAEREAAYQAARSRIFMGFEEKTKDRESASSSTFSLISASGSGSQSGGAGGSAASDDDNASSAPTESEWSVPGTDRRRGGDSGMSSAGSAHSYRANSMQYNANGGGSSGRASGAASPALTYPSLYDQNSHPNGYDQAAYTTSPGSYMSAPYPMYAYPPPPAGGPGGHPAPFMAAYPYYAAPFHYGPPSAHPPHPASDPTSPSIGPVDGYNHHSAPVMGPHPYGWVTVPPTQIHTTPDAHSPPVTGPPQVLPPPVHGPPPAPAPYPPQYPYMSSPYPGYPPFFTSPPQQHAPFTHPNPQSVYPVTDHSGRTPEQSNGQQNFSPSGNGSPSPTISRNNNISGGPYNSAPVNKRGAPPTRSVWSYGPGVGLHNNTTGAPIHFPSGNNTGEVVGPRLSSTVRRISGASSGSNGSRTPGDETASTASSSASSSSSRRTYLTASPKHPLPPRPDWAAGLKPQPTLHSTSRNRHDSNNSRNMSPAARPHQQLHHHLSPPQQSEIAISQSNADFPPLSSRPSLDKRPAVVGGAWSNPNPVRTIFSSNAANTNQLNGSFYDGKANNISAGGPGMSRLDESDAAFERPTRKSNGELFNPKGGPKRPGTTPLQVSTPSSASSRGNGNSANEKERGEIIESAILVNKISSLKLSDTSGNLPSPKTSSEIEQTNGSEKATSSGKLGLMDGSTAPISTDA